MISVKAEQPWGDDTFTAANLHAAVRNMANTFTTRFEAQGWRFPITVLANEVFHADDEPLAPFQVTLLGRHKRTGQAEYAVEGL